MAVREAFGGAAVLLLEQRVERTRRGFFGEDKTNDADTSGTDVFCSFGGKSNEGKPQGS